MLQLNLKIGMMIFRGHWDMNASLHSAIIVELLGTVKWNARRKRIRTVVWRWFNSMKIGYKHRRWGKGFKMAINSSYGHKASVV